MASPPGSLMINRPQVIIGDDNIFVLQAVEDMAAISTMFLGFPFIFLSGNIFPYQGRSWADFQNQGLVIDNFLHGYNTGAAIL